MKKKEFIAMVKEEIINIKKHASDEELNRLDFNKFNPWYASQDIYGQMTGYCFNARTLGLIKKCTPIVVDDLGAYDGLDKRKPLETFRDISGRISYEKPTDKNVRCWARDFSILELYITLKGAKNRGIIKYLRGESKELEL